MPARGNAPEGDVLELREDGTVQIGWDGFRTILRRPKVGEWLSFIEEGEIADQWVRNETDAESSADAPKPRSLIDQAGPDGPYLTLWVRMLKELGDADVNRNDLPPWCCVGGAFLDVSRWWRSSPLLRPAIAGNLTTPSR